MRSAGTPLHREKGMGMGHEHGFQVILLGLVICVGAGFALSTCEDDDYAAQRKALTNQGFTDVDIGSYAFFGCSESDVYSNHFTATNTAGKPVEGLVCCGLMKACTVRW